MGMLFKNGNYVKLNLEDCYIDIHGIHVAYSSYSSKQSREQEQKITDKLEKFYRKCNDYCVSLEDKINNSLTFNPEEIKSEEEFVSRLTDEQKKDIELLNDILNDIHIIQSFVYNRDKEILNELKNIDILKDLGYSKELLQEFETPCSACELTGLLTNQKFTHNSMYKELKKLFKKEEYSDC